MHHLFRPLRTFGLVCALLGLVAEPVAATSPARPGDRTQPLRRAHAHNDYEHARPLFDALDHGFTSVEVDVYLVGGELLVGHDPADLRPDRTLRSLYLEPLRARVIDNHGSVHPGDRGLFQLMIDVKSTARTTYARLDSVLRRPRYSFLFTRYHHGNVHRGPVTAVVSGNRARARMQDQQDRLAFYDGRIASEDDLGVGADPELVPIVSENWTELFDWTGAGPMPAAEREKLRRIVDEAHAAGQRVRFWATPDEPGSHRTAVWEELLAAGVDHINTDDLAGLEAFLRARR